MTSRRPKRPQYQQSQVEAEILENIEQAIEIEKAIEDVTEALEKAEELAERLDPPHKDQKPTRVFLSDEDRRMLKKFNKYIVNKLGIASNRSFKV